VLVPLPCSFSPLGPFSAHKTDTGPVQDEPAEFDFGEERRQAAAAAAGAEWFPQGTRVNARWKGSRFYPGTVGRTHEDGTVQVFFDDGDYEEREPVADILRM